MEKKEYILNTRYICEDDSLEQELNRLIEKYQVLQLVAPQGSGKTEFFRRLPYKKALLSPTRALSEQSGEGKRTICAFGRNEYYLTVTGSVDEYGMAKPDTQTYSTTFFSSKAIYTEFLQDAEVLIVDEAHKIVQYSSFAMDSVNSLKNTIQNFLHDGKKVIFVTATPDLLVCMKKEAFYRKLECDIRIKTHRPRISRLVLLRYNKDTLKKLLEQNDTGVNMQLVLTIDKAAMDEMAGELTEKGIPAISIHSGNRGEELQKTYLQRLTATQEEVTDYRIVLATSWIDVGINFNNRNITHLYYMVDDRYQTGDLESVK